MVAVRADGLPPDAELLPLADWRCGNCGSQERLLGQFTELGGVRLVTRSHHRRRDVCPRAREVLLDLRAAQVGVHCSHCHAWRSLTYVREVHTWIEGPWSGVQPPSCP